MVGRPCRNDRTQQAVNPAPQSDPPPASSVPGQFLQTAPAGSRISHPLDFVPVTARQPPGPGSWRDRPGGNRGTAREYDERQPLSVLTLGRILRQASLGTSRAGKAGECVPDDTPNSPREADGAGLEIEPGKPIRFSGIGEGVVPDPEGSRVLGQTFKAYREASKSLLEGKYAAFRQFAPPHIREPSSAFVLACADGIIVRYDPPDESGPKVRVGRALQPLAEITPAISENVLHFPTDPATYVPPAGGVRLSIKKHDGQTDTVQEVMSMSLMIFASTALPSGTVVPAPGARPLLLVGIPNEFEFHIQGTVEPAGPHGSPRELNQETSFLARSRIALPVGWRAIEVYPLLGSEYWKPEFAPAWAELDILAATAQRNLLEEGFRRLDSRTEARKQWEALLAEFETLLHGPEEPVHQFLKLHPKILSSTYSRCWSKVPFGDRVSDFVFCDAPADYELVEIEAPVRELFRKDGQQRQELTHAIDQTVDWLQYIKDNKGRVEAELGLAGISTTPRTLVVIGRSESLSDENRRKLVTLQERQPRLRILTYDDVLARARADLERLLGPLSMTGHNVEFYFFQGDASRH